MKLKTVILLVLVAFFCSCSRHFQPKVVETELISVIQTEHSQSNEMSQWLLPYKTTLDKVMGVKIGESAQKLEAGVPESLLGNFVTEVMKDYAKKHGETVDFAITNIGGLRDSLPKGELTVGDIYKMFPFDNELVILTLDGEKVKELCQIIAEQGGQVTSGINMVIIEKKGEYIKIGGKLLDLNSGKPVDLKKKYKVLTTDYLSFGNDGLFPLAEYSDIYSFKMPLREIIIDYIKNEYKNDRKINAKLNNEVVLDEKWFLTNSYITIDNKKY
ncbi:MAG: 5'-nucleotidase C-terminal domain-containing protein [Prevotellaceae bacterium]|jgi:2',3'-cyclic-nucleotide 2'-phosphodiesterase (5'-nucleotidase family)|nr:5'-nucleotidase C-terminal domain-containing protein [Prevotellaceae bacterium]